jgi:hypothetical protein
MYIFPDENQANFLVSGMGETKGFQSSFVNTTILMRLFNVPMVRQYVALIGQGYGYL